LFNNGDKYLSLNSSKVSSEKISSSSNNHQENYGYENTFESITATEILDPSEFYDSHSMKEENIDYKYIQSLKLKSKMAYLHKKKKLS